MKKNVLLQSLSFLLWMSLFTGVLYPAFVTLAAGLVFPDKAGGSLLLVGGQVRGSRLLAQDFRGEKGWFLARPSATGWSTLPSGASNLAATNPDFAKEEAANAAAWAEASGQAGSQAIAPAGAQAQPPAKSLPPDMATTSGSGLDPDISLEAALGQLDRVSAVRGLDAAAKAALGARIRAMAAASESLLGPARVNVVELNGGLAGDSPPVAAAPSTEAGLPPAPADRAGK